MKKSEFTHSECQELPKIKKKALALTDPHYQTSKTSLLVFDFEPICYTSSLKRLNRSQIQSTSIDGKEVYILDDFFTEEEGRLLRDFSAQATFSRNSYGSPEAIENGEKPARSMDGKERWQFFSHPPEPIFEIYKLFGTLADRLGAEITTLPWELCDPAGNGSPSVIGNFVEEASHESMELGKHQDSNPQKGLPFAIPVLYAPEPSFHPQSFPNGEKGFPWIVSVMLYVNAENYHSNYCIGTAFYGTDQSVAIRSAPNNMRLVLFESDLFHTIEESCIPEGVKTWRVSYVYKIIINPRQKNESMKQKFAQLSAGLRNVPDPLADLEI